MSETKYDSIIEKLGDPTTMQLTKEAQDKIYSDVAGVDGIMDLLRDMMIGDLWRYFNASTDEARNQARGAYLRTQYIWGRIGKVNEQKH